MEGYQHQDLNPQHHNTSHDALVKQAKVNQKKCVQSSNVLSAQLQNNLGLLLANNSTAENSACSSVLDKITTIHQLDKEVDRQLKEDIAGNAEALSMSNSKLNKLLNNFDYKLQLDQAGNDTGIESLQRRAELIDQELRILEQTVVYIKQDKEL